jgi:hypothetical protein
MWVVLVLVLVLGVLLLLLLPLLLLYSNSIAAAICLQGRVCGCEARGRRRAGYVRRSRGVSAVRRDCRGRHAVVAAEKTASRAAATVEDARVADAASRCVPVATAGMPLTRIPLCAPSPSHSSTVHVALLRPRCTRPVPCAEAIAKAAEMRRNQQQT